MTENHILQLTKHYLSQGAKAQAQFCQYMLLHYTVQAVTYYHTVTSHALPCKNQGPVHTSGQGLNTKISDTTACF
jgi:hypothetical protein